MDGPASPASRHVVFGVLHGTGDTDGPGGGRCAGLPSRASAGATAGPTHGAGEPRKEISWTLEHDIFPGASTASPINGWYSVSDAFIVPASKSRRPCATRTNSCTEIFCFGVCREANYHT